MWELWDARVITDDLAAFAWNILAAYMGAVAQLGERRVRNAEVGSSILLGSTNFSNQINNLQLEIRSDERPVSTRKQPLR